MEILGSRRACSEFGVRRSLFAGSQFAVRRFSELRIPNSEPRTLLFAGWPNTDFRRSPVRNSLFAGSPNSEYRTPNPGLCCSRGGRIPEFAVRRFAIRNSLFAGWPNTGVRRFAGSPNTEYRTPNLPPSALRTPPFAGSQFAVRGVFFRVSDSAGLPEYRTPNSEPPPSPFRPISRLVPAQQRGEAGVGPYVFQERR